MSDDLERVLIDLADEARPLHSVDVSQLSDLARPELEDFQAAWGHFSAARRRELISSMVGQAEANIQLNFHAILRACLSDGDAQVRRLSIEGLWEDERVNLIRPLILILANDVDASVRAAAAVSLGRFVLLGELEEIPDEPARAAEQALREAWFRPGEVNEVRRRALEGLSYTAGAGVHELIQNAYYDEDALMRQSAVFSMGRSNHPRWARIVLEELNSAEPEMRFEAAQAAGEMALRAAVQPLIRRLEDIDGVVREAAVSALGKIGGPAAKRALENVVAGSDEVLAQAAEDALDEWSFNSENLDNLLMDVEERASHERMMLENGLAGDLDLESLDDEFGDLEGDDYDLDDEGLEDDDLEELSGFGESGLEDEDDYGPYDDEFELDGFDDDFDGDDFDTDDDEADE